MIQVQPTDRLVFDLEMSQIDFNEQKKESLRAEISKKYNVPLQNVEVNFVPKTTTNSGETITLTSDIISNIQDTKFQQSLFKDYLNVKEIKDVDFDEILKIDNQVNALVSDDTYHKARPYKIKSLKWSNYLSYGKDNFFDFTKLNGLVLLTGEPENTSGKTTLAIDLLRFALFGRAEKSPTLDTVFNLYLEEETEVVVEACIEIDSIDYVIRRTVTRPALARRTEKSKAKQKVEYFKVVNGEYTSFENLQGENTAQTNDIIKDTVGDVNDYDLVISATSYSLGDLLRLGQTDKGKLFSRWLGLLSIEEKERIAKDLWKKQKTNLFSNVYNKTTLETEVKDMELVIANNNKSMSEIEEKINQSTKKIDELNETKTNTIKKRREIKDELLQLDVETIESKLKQKTDELDTLRKTFLSKKDRFNEIKDVSFNNEEYSNKQQEQRNVDIRQAELRANISTLQKEIGSIEQLIAQKICPTCKQPINVADKESNIEELKQKIKEYTNEGVKNKQTLDNIAKELQELLVKQTTENELNRLKPELSALKVQIDNIKLQLESLTNQKNEINKNKENIQYNNDIDVKVNLITEHIKTETNIKETNIKEYQNLKNEIANLNKDIEERSKLIKKIIDEEKLIRNWNVYQELVGKDGIVKIVLKKALPILNNEIARLLNGLCDFDVVLTIDNDNKIDISMVQDNVKKDLSICGSGWETTISSIALRTALSNIASLPRPNICVFDEVLSGVSTQNMENIFQLFRRILPNYSNIIHICHDNTLIDYHDQTVVVTKENNISKVNLK